MVDLLAAAERCRAKASQCKQSAKNTTSPHFAKCYRELARLFDSIADVDEGFVRRDLAAMQETNAKLIPETGLTPR
jgi:hypothetical protein